MAKKIRELMADGENMDVLHESHGIFRREQDEQLVQWMNRFTISETRNDVVCERMVLHVQFFPMSIVLLMFVTGDQMTGLFLLAAVEPFMVGVIIIGVSLGASKVQKLKSPLHVKPLQLSDPCS